MPQDPAADRPARRRPDRRPNYWDYIRVEELLALQGGLEEDESALTDDEVLFITVHQVYELWFKLVRRELTSMRDLFKGDPVEERALAGAVRSAERVIAVMRRCVDQFEVMETLSTASYLGFRDKLMPASGFQSAQLRQIEILLGLEDEQRIPLGSDESYVEALRAHDGGDSPALARVQRQLADRPSLKEAFAEWLHRTPIDGSGPGDADAEERLDAFVADYRAAHGAMVDRSCELALERTLGDVDRDRLRARHAEEKRALEGFLDAGADAESRRRRRIRAALLFLLSYPDLALLAWPNRLVEAVLALEQTFLVFRQRHARMVERVIGRRTGTGGSSGVDYLDQTALRYRVFRDLWEVRTYQIPSEHAPALRRPEFYGFRNE